MRSPTAANRGAETLCQILDASDATLCVASVAGRLHEIECHRVHVARDLLELLCEIGPGVRHRHDPKRREWQSD
jgi:hypothetical protein